MAAARPRAGAEAAPSTLDAETQERPEECFEECSSTASGNLRQYSKPRSLRPLRNVKVFEILAKCMIYENSVDISTDT